MGGIPADIQPLSPIWTPGKDASMRARTAVGEDRRWNSRGLPEPPAPRKRTLNVGPGTKPVKNPSVWQRWQVNVPSNRMQREEVLERDRERQREHYDSDNRRNFASPARSHAASLFFAS